MQVERLALENKSKAIAIDEVHPLGPCIRDWMLFYDKLLRKMKLFPYKKKKALRLSIGEVGQG